ncbi:hypothetical protein HDF15_002856 [Granulicella mallensis]|uniref:Uncharacterized protein n=1 Tax=Granulicella mallensis TaxID=940614 RepID=A0A7W7ZRK1_9BACT|nr:hypothetical protein [Granulicella mallensis]
MRVAKDAECADNFDAKMPGFLSTESLIDEQQAASMNVRQRNGFALSGIKLGVKAQSGGARITNFQPIGSALDPTSDTLWGERNKQLLSDGYGDDNRAIELRKDIDILDEHQIVQGTCIGNDDHLVRLCGSRSFKESVGSLYILLEIFDRKIEIDPMLPEQFVDLHAGFISQHRADFTFR